jgi:hypothetical protein
MNITYSYVTEQDKTAEPSIAEADYGATVNHREKHKHRIRRRIKEVASLLNIDLTSADICSIGKSAATSAIRDDSPICEFGESDKLFVQAWPQIFMFGSAGFYDTGGKLLKDQQVEHLLMQYTNSAATTREILFYLFDAQSRHKFIQNLASKVRAGPLAFEQYAAFVDSPGF